MALACLSESLLSSTKSDMADDQKSETNGGKECRVSIKSAGCYDTKWSTRQATIESVSSAREKAGGIWVH